MCMHSLVYLIGFFAAASGVFCYLSFNYKSQIYGKMIWRVETDKKLIALTFDDGPNTPFTLQIADIIESYGGRSTFFVVGKNCMDQPEVITEIKNRGHEIGIHSYSHKFSKYITQPSYEKEILETKQILNTFGVYTELFRFPWLFRTPWLLKAVERHKLLPISGKFAHMLEPIQPSASTMAKRVVKIAQPGLIVIFHDGYDAKGGDRTQTVIAINEVCKILSKQGYKFVTVGELLKLSGKDS